MSDLIDRQEAIDALKKSEELELNNFTDTSPISMMTVATITNCIEEIVKLPSAEPEQTLESAIDYLHSVGWLQEHDRILTESEEPEWKKGEWVYDGIRGRFPACKCSICGHYENADWALLQGVNFCPHCGADMRENKR